MKTMQKNETRIEKGLTGNALKWIAVASMVIDHSAVALIQKGFLYPGSDLDVSSPLYNTITLVVAVMRMAGRLAMPIFYFLMVEGFIHTRSRWKYLRNILIFAVISEVPFDMALFRSTFYAAHQNIFFNMALSLLGLIVWDLFTEGNTEKASLDRKFMAAAFYTIICMFATVLCTDYLAYGPMLALIFYLNRKNEVWRGVLSAWLFTLMTIMGFKEIAACIDVFILHFYNGKRGKQNKYFFYVFYPAHFILLVLIRYLIFK